MTYDFLVCNLRVIGTVEAKEAKPPRQSPEHRVGSKPLFRQAAQLTHPRFDTYSIPASAPDCAPEREQGYIVLAVAVLTGNRHPKFSGGCSIVGKEWSAAF
jgi:hypothetical protein